MKILNNREVPEEIVYGLSGGLGPNVELLEYLDLYSLELVGFRVVLHCFLAYSDAAGSSSHFDPQTLHSFRLL